MSKEEIEELAFKDRKVLANLSEIDLLEIIDFLQLDRKQWINQYTISHNDYVSLQQENKQLKDNWNKLREWLEELLQEEFDINGFTGVCTEIRINCILDKMEELEKGDSNE